VDTDTPKIPSYPKVYNLGHTAIADLFKDPVIVEEKIDGSQFSFGILDGKLCARSRTKQIDLDDPDNLFAVAVERIRSIEHLLREGMVWRGEYLAKPRHNGLAYDRVPHKNIMIWDIETAPGSGFGPFLEPETRRMLADLLGFESVPALFAASRALSMEDFGVHFFDRTSILGGQKIEGVVIKNYHRFGRDGKILAGKFVSPCYKEIQRKQWTRDNPGVKDILALLVAEHRTDARWEKAIQHVREAGELTDEPRDIPALIKALHVDLDEECRSEIANRLAEWAMPKVKRGVVRGFAEYYKHRLMERQFEADRAEEVAGDQPEADQPEAD
jgi:hypothetical protein